MGNGKRKRNFVPVVRLNNMAFCSRFGFTGSEARARFASNPTGAARGGLCISPTECIFAHVVVAAILAGFVVLCTRPSYYHGITDGLLF